MNQGRDIKNTQISNICTDNAKETWCGLEMVTVFYGYTLDTPPSNLLRVSGLSSVYIAFYSVVQLTRWTWDLRKGQSPEM